jgi:excisionase family DNA binding protein
LASVHALASPLFFGAGDFRYTIFDCQAIYVGVTIIFSGWYTWAMKIISTAEAARRLGVTANRVRAMIEAKRLKATKVGNVWLIDPKDLDAVKDRKVGRPRKSRKSVKK